MIVFSREESWSSTQTVAIFVRDDDANIPAMKGQSSTLAVSGKNSLGTFMIA